MSRDVKGNIDRMQKELQKKKASKNKSSKDPITEMAKFANQSPKSMFKKSMADLNRLLEKKK